MYTRKYNFTAEEMSCRNCAEYLPGGSCKQRKCPYMDQRIEANTVTYGDALSAICFPNRKVRKRLLFLITEYPDSFWLDENHKARMKQLHDRLGFTEKRNTPRYYAAMYLLTASDTLLSQTIKCFTDTDIDFSFAALPGISLDDYILYKAAVCYYTKEGGVTLGELADEELICDQMFRLVINGLLIAKYGLVAMILKKHKEDEFYRLLKIALQNANAVKKSGGCKKVGENQELIENLPVPKALATLAIPTSVIQLITMIYNLSDTYFIGLTNNPYQIAAASLAYVLVFVMTALSKHFGVGGGSLISRLLGGQKTEESKHVCAFSFYGAIVISFIYSLACYVFMDPLLRLLGASDSTIDFSANYAFGVVVIGGVPSTLSMTMAQLLRSEGYAKKASFGLGMGGVLNIALDPVFMFVILPAGQEVTGAGMTTMLSNVISLCYFLLVFFRLRKNTVLSLSIHRLPVGVKYIAPVLSVGFPSALPSLLACISNMAANNLASGYGDIPVAAMGLVKKINMLPMNVGMGLCQGMLPLVAYNYATKNYKRMKSVINFARISEMGFAVLCIIVFELFSGNIVALFIKESETLTLSSEFLRISSLATPFTISNFQMAYTLQAMGKGPQSLLLSSCRQGILYIPLMILMNLLFQLNGVVWAKFIAYGLTLVISFIVCRQVCRQFSE